MTRFQILLDGVPVKGLTGQASMHCILGVFRDRRRVVAMVGSCNIGKSTVKR